MPNDEIEKLVGSIPKPEPKRIDIPFPDISALKQRIANVLKKPEENIDRESEQALAQLSFEFTQFIVPYFNTADGRGLSIHSEREAGTSNPVLYFYYDDGQFPENSIKSKGKRLAIYSIEGQYRIYNEVYLKSYSYDERSNVSSKNVGWRFESQASIDLSAIETLKMALARHISYQRTALSHGAQAALDRAGDKVNASMDRMMDRFWAWMDGDKKKSILLPLVFSLASASGGHHNSIDADSAVAANGALSQYSQPESGLT
jgi:hypothetical protein